MLTYNILLSGSRAGDDYVFRFQVSVCDLHGVKVFDAFGDVTD